MQRTRPDFGAALWTPEETRLRNVLSHTLKTAICAGEGPTLSELRVLHILKSLLMDIRSKGRKKAQPDSKSYLVLLSANGLQLFLLLQKLVPFFFFFLKVCFRSKAVILGKLPVCHCPL